MKVKVGKDFSRRPHEGLCITRMRTVNRLLMRPPKCVEEGLAARKMAVNRSFPNSRLPRNSRKSQLGKARVLETARNGIENQFDSGSLLPSS